MASVIHPEPAVWLARPNLPILEIAALLGYRVVIIDMEHGAITQEACDALVAQGQLLGLTVILRVSEARHILVQQALDYGAADVMLPMIRDATHAAEARVLRSIHHKERAASVRAAHSPMAHIIQSTKISIGRRTPTRVATS